MKSTRYVDGRMRPFVDSRKQVKGQSLKDILNSSAVKNAVTSVTGGSRDFREFTGNLDVCEPAP